MRLLSPWWWWWWWWGRSSSSDWQCWWYKLKNKPQKFWNRKCFLNNWVVDSGNGKIQLYLGVLFLDILNIETEFKLVCLVVWADRVGYLCVYMILQVFFLGLYFQYIYLYVICYRYYRRAELHTTIKIVHYNLIRLHNNAWLNSESLEICRIE